MCELTTRVFERMGAAAAPARAHFWVVQPDQVMVRGNAAGETIAGGSFSGSDNPLEGLEHIAGVTAAERLSLATAGDATLVQIAHETTSYYSAVLETTAADLDGINRGLDVRVARTGVEVRARPHLFMPKPNTARPIAKTPAEMMKESRLSYDLPLRATAYAVARERRWPDDEGRRRRRADRSDGEAHGLVGGALRRTGPAHPSGRRRRRIN